MTSSGFFLCYHHLTLFISSGSLEAGLPAPGRVYTVTLNLNDLHIISHINCTDRLTDWLTDWLHAKSSRLPVRHTSPVGVLCSTVLLWLWLQLPWEKTQWAPRCMNVFLTEAVVIAARSTTWRSSASGKQGQMFWWFYSNVVINALNIPDLIWVDFVDVAFKPGILWVFHQTSEMKH